MSDSNFGKMFVNVIVASIAGRWISVIKTEAEIAKIELGIKAKQIGKGVGMLAAAAVLAFFMTLVLLAAAVAGLSVVWPVWLAALAVGGVILLIVLILALAGSSKIKKNKDLVPHRAINNIKNSMPF